MFAYYLVPCCVTCTDAQIKPKSTSIEVLVFGCTKPLTMLQLKKQNLTIKSQSTLEIRTKFKLQILRLLPVVIPLIGSQTQESRSSIINTKQPEIKTQTQKQ